MLGRFELRRVLGQGAQATVWLAFDPRLEREVAVKLMRVEPQADASDMAQWLQEARSVSRLNHPHIIALFEADLHHGLPYLVFEYVQGQNLSELLRQRGALPAQEAVGLMVDVLEALAAAHRAGVVHRDLKPSNVLVDASGRARVMDFGIAARIQDAAGELDSVPGGGTPGYISPEAVMGSAPAVAMDIFSSALVLAEMLSGQPLIAERDPQQAIRRVVSGPLELPIGLSSEVDDELRSILRRALAQEPAQRHASVEAFQDELEKWLKPADEEIAGEGHSATLEFLLRRMRRKSDFPAMSNTVVRIQRISSSDKESVASLTNEILKDVAMTNKLLRLVNTAHYSRGGTISTVSRAVMLVGFNGVRNMTLSLVLLEHMEDKAHASLLREEFLRSLMAGAIAGELCSSPKDREEAFIGAMFQNLGRLLTDYYFPEEARAVRLLMGCKEPVSEAAAAHSVLGITYEALGVGIAKVWNLPASIRRSIRIPLGEPPSAAPRDPVEILRWMTLASNEMADVLLRNEPQEVPAKLARISHRYARSIGTSSREVEAATSRAREKFAELARAMDIQATPGSAAARLLQQLPNRAVVVADADTEATMRSHELQATPAATSGAGKGAVSDAQQVSDMLAAGIQDITNAMVEDNFRLSDVLRMILETMLRAMAFRNIIFCMRDPKTDAITGRFGLGLGVEQRIKAFHIELKSSTPDIFSAVCAKGADTMISDATEPRIADRLPAWYRKSSNAPTFLLLPLMLKGAPFGLIYADKGEMGGLQLGDKELALLRTLRNQAVMAFRQSS